MPSIPHIHLFPSASLTLHCLLGVTAPSFTMERSRTSSRPDEPCYHEGYPHADVTPANDRPAPPLPRPDDEVLVGVGNKAGRDFDMDVSKNDAIGGRVRLGVGNDASRDNRGRALLNGVHDADGDVAVGVGNSAGCDNKMGVVNNVVTGGGCVRVGVGNRAGRDNTIVVAGNRILHRCRTSCRPDEPCYLEGCPHPANHRPAPPLPRPDDEVLVGVGNKADRDFDMDVSKNDVIGGRGWARHGVGNDPSKDNRGGVQFNSIKDADGDMAIGVGNSAGRDNEVHVVDNVVTDGGGVQAGVGNRAGRDNKTVVAGNVIVRVSPPKGKTQEACICCSLV